MAGPHKNTGWFKKTRLFLKVVIPVYDHRLLVTIEARSFKFGIRLGFG